MKWKYVKPISNSNYISMLSRELNFQFPIEYLECVQENNAGKPEFSNFDTDNSKEKVLDHFLSINKTDRANIFDMNTNNENLYNTNCIMFAVDVFGNPICFVKNTKNIVLINHETQQIEQIATDFVDFLEKLY